MTAESPTFDVNSQAKLEIDKYAALFRTQITLLPVWSGLDRYLDVNGMQKVEVDILPPGKILAVSKKFPVHNPPNQHVDENGQPTSDAEYYIDEYETEDGHVIYLSKLRPKSLTSRHRHPSPVKEFYFLLLGGAFQNGYPMKQRSAVPSGEYHQVTTAEEPALFGILMKDAAKIPKHERHLP